MADSTTRITGDMLRDVSKACLRHDTLKAANTALVNCAGISPLLQKHVIVNDMYVPIILEGHKLCQIFEA